MCLGISAIYPSLQCQSSSGSVGKSIWPEFRRLKFKSWLDLNFFLRQVILNVICILELWQGFAAVLTCLLKISTAEYHAIVCHSVTHDGYGVIFKKGVQGLRRHNGKAHRDCLCFSNSAWPIIMCAPDRSHASKEMKYYTVHCIVFAVKVFCIYTLSSVLFYLH